MKPWLKNLIRFRPENLDRSKYLRLDKNERTVNFEKSFLKYLKKNINTYTLAAYPSVNKIYNLIAKKNKVSKNMICLTSGSDLAIKTCIEYFTEKKKKIITLNPTFGMVDVYCALYNLKKIQIGYDKYLRLDLNKLFKELKKNVSLLILANPNSPTGTIIKKKNIIKILKKSKNLKIPVVIDEAYFGFYKTSYVKLVQKFKNLAIIRTFSKSFGIAGLRAGYIISNKDTISELYKYKPMYEISSLSCLALEYLLKKPSIEKNFINTIYESKNLLINKFRKKLKYLNTYGNFFHVDLGKNKKRIEKILKKNKILFRKGPGVDGFESYLRLSLGSPKQMQKVANLILKNI